MALNIHFTAEDLCHIRIAPGADPMWELLLSLHVVGAQPNELVFGGWRRKVTREWPKGWEPLLDLAPSQGYSADFLTPAEGATSLAEGLELVLHTPTRELAADMRRLPFGLRVPTWAKALVDGEAAVLRALVRMLGSYFENALEPGWRYIRNRADEERARLARLVLGGGVDALLSGLHPTLRWEFPTLQAINKVVDRDIELRGRGLTLVPTFFAHGDSSLLSTSDDVPLVLAYPLSHEVGWTGTDDERTDHPLDAVLGRSRARMLELVEDRPCTTGDLATRLELAPASASHHAKALREAGLVTSTQHGRWVLHRSTRLGAQLLDGRPVRI